MTDSPTHVAPRQAASPPAPARSRLGLAGGCGWGVTTPPPHPLLGLALTHAVRLVDRRSADILFFSIKGHARKTTPPNPKIDKGATGYDGLAYACGAAASRVAACSGSF